jgi:hypothetical protein
MLYDVPVEPLIAARPEAKGSLLGLLSLAFLAHHQETCAQVRRIMESGTGAMVIDLSGGPGAPSASWQLFDDRSAYEEFLPTLMLVRADSSMP